MGKGDRRSRKGKIRIGSYGNSRRRKESKFRFIPKPKAKPTFVEVRETVAPIEATTIITTAQVELATTTVDAPVKTKVKKATAKKTTVKKAVAKKTPAAKNPVKKK